MSPESKVRVTETQVKQNQLKVCLMFPAIRNFGWNSLGIHLEGIYINHGLASMSAVLKQDGHEVCMIDLRETRNWSEVYQRMKQVDADFYGVYMSTLDFHEAKMCAVYAQDLGKKSIVGGPHPSICAEHTLENTDFDYVFVGEAEKTLPELLKYPEKFSRLVIGESPNLDELPYEDREIFNMKKVLATQHPFYSQPFLSIICGRGCPFQCSFCKPGEDKIFGKFRMRGIDHFMGEILFLAKKYRYNTLMIDDDSFTVNPRFVESFCEAYQNVKRPFVCQSRADFIVKHPDLIKMLRKVGLKSFLIGFESGNQRILDLLRKDITVEQNLEAAEICHKNGVEVWANIMFGMPTETKEEVSDTAKMVEKIKPQHFSPAFYTPIPGTSLYDYCREEDLLLSEDPAHLGSRAPTEPKIRGIDYAFLSEVVRNLYGLV